MIKNIGYMQGRLSDQEDNKIQSFPWSNWENEFYIANNINFKLMEWTLDYNNLYQNPLLTESGRLNILKLSKKYKIKINSITCDCFMQKPFWKLEREETYLKNQFLDVINATAKIGIKIIVIPLVDNGSIENVSQQNKLLNFCKMHTSFLKKRNTQIAFESDYEPIKLAKLINELDNKSFGINYDMGNSASFGFSSKEECSLYGDRILNVHIKDRKFNGSTVALGEGNTNFYEVFNNLQQINYNGNYILQVARSNQKKHKEVLEISRKKVLSWMQGDFNETKI